MPQINHAFVVQGMEHELLRARPPAVRIRRAVGVIEGFRVPGLHITGPKRQLNAYLGHSGLTESSRLVELKRILIPAYYGEASGGAMLSIQEGHALAADENAKDELMRILAELSEILGYDMALHLRTGDSYAPGGSWGTLNIVIGASPPGRASIWRCHKACGVSFNDTSSPETYAGASDESSVTIRDPNGDQFAQFYDNVLYLFLPLSELRHLRLYTGSHSLLLTAVRTAWNQLQSGKVDLPVQQPLVTARHYTEAVETLRGTMVASLGRNVSKIEQDIERLTKALNEKYFTLARTKTLLDIAGTMPEEDASRPDEWRRIRKLGFGISKIGGSIVFGTGAVSILHDQAEYPLGEFRISFTAHGTVVIWNVTPTHPRGVPHPHISESGGICFGNATAAIHEAITSLRRADALALIREWLVHGYDETLTRHKITEWKQKEFKNETDPGQSARTVTPQLLPPSKTLRSTSKDEGRTSGRGPDWLVVRTLAGKVGLRRPRGLGWGYDLLPQLADVALWPDPRGKTKSRRTSRARPRAHGGRNQRSSGASKKSPD